MLGKNEAETAAAMSPLRAVFRYLTNPTGQAATGTVVNFLFFFSMMYQGMTCLMLVGRLRVSKVWDTEVLSGSAAALMVRVVPYSLILTAAVGAALAVLVNLGQLRFLGKPFLFLALFFLTGVANGLVAMLLSWRCTNPGGGASFMIWLVPPGFILGGATMAIGFAHPWVRALSEGIPLVHTFSFWRDIGLRGIDFAGMSGAIGQFFFYLLFLAGLVSLRFWHEGRERRKAVKLAWRQLSELPNEMAVR